jgi:SPP1 gp7 family putative phage head morphogenesis protein
MLRRVFQDHSEGLNTGPGNCMQAAAASLLGLPLEAVPNFILYPNPNAMFRKAFEALGFELLEKPVDFIPPSGYYFEVGMSTQGHPHIVVCMGGARIHDPNPRGGGLVTRDAVLWPRPLTARAKRIVMALDSKLEEPEAVVLRPIYANEGVRVWYQDQLQCVARAMAIDILRKLRKAYRPAADRLGMDDDPIVTLRLMMRVWGRRWLKRFDDMSKDVAAAFASKTSRYTDAQFRRRLKDAGFTVSFRPSARQVSAYRAVVAENVNLIRSIPREFLKDVESAVWNSVMRGGSMHELSTTVRKRYGITYRRAALIARDQVNKSKAVMENARRAELGITEAVWQHSHAGKEPRPTHVKMDGRRFKIADGMYDSAEGRKVQPGELINCRCTSRAVMPGGKGATK